MTNPGIKQQLVELAPWHMDIRLPDGSSTIDGNQKNFDDPNFQEVSVVKTLEMRQQISQLYPGGLQGKSLLDVGCNAGAYCIMAHELGADFAYGFDVREHWINQARFVARTWEIPETRVEFQTHHLHELGEKRKFDITIFKGVFYHLPDPIHALKTLSDVTNETIIVDTGTRNDIPEDCLIAKLESTTHVMSGVDQLSWYPGGPGALTKILNWCGFAHCATGRWVHNKKSIEKRPSKKKLNNIGRLRVVASRNKEVIERFEEQRKAA